MAPNPKFFLSTLSLFTPAADWGWHRVCTVTGVAGVSLLEICSGLIVKALALLESTESLLELTELSAEGLSAERKKFLTN